MGLVGLAINATIVIIAAIKDDPVARSGDPVAMREVIIRDTSRHILSTTVTTVGGFFPLIMAGGSFWPPFAVAIAGGTALTTIVSFYFTPAAYRLLMGWRQAADRTRGRNSDKTDLSGDGKLAMAAE